ncbi:MAG: 50S ribosomal protein L22 [Actinobacteria bacterium]|nr:50S ribosomal protein L22 [Actinomycetota bacterium]
MSTINLVEVAGARATHRFARMSASKVRVVLNLIRDTDVDDAKDILRFSERGASDVVAKVLASAIANASHNEGLDENELYIAECFADEGPTLKRWRPRARGRATRIFKRTCHITVVVAQLDDEDLDVRLQAEAASGTTPGASRPDRRARVAASQAADTGSDDTDTGAADIVDPVDDAIGEASAATDVAPEADGSDEAALEEWNAEDGDADGEANVTDETPYGPGSIAPPADDSIPEGFLVKGNADSMKYHEPDGRWYENTVAEVYFATAEHAAAAGFIKAGTKEPADDNGEEA